MSNLVEQLTAIPDELVTQMLNALNALDIPDETPLFFYPGTAEYNRYWRIYTDKMTMLCDLCDKVNPYEYNSIYLCRNMEREKGCDHTRYGPQASISLGESKGNKLYLDDELVDDRNRLVLFDGTKIPYHTSQQLEGDIYRIHFFKI
jgi:hypothetical protein